MAAAMTYYTMLSLAPLLMIAIAIAGYMFDHRLVESEIREQVKLFTTDDVANTVASLITQATKEHAARPSSGIIAGLVSLLVLVYGASGVFSQLHDTFNEIWQVPASQRKGWWFTVKERLIGITLVLVAGVVLVVAIGMDAAFGMASNMIKEHYPSVESYLQLADRGMSYMILPLLLAMLFWLIPAVKVEWRDVWLASMITALLIGVSRYIINYYVELSMTNEVYGPAGSLVVLLIWVYMTGLIVFLGASFSRAWANTFGSRWYGEVDKEET